MKKVILMNSGVALEIGLAGSSKYNDTNFLVASYIQATKDAKKKEKEIEIDREMQKQKNNSCKLQH